MVHGWFIYTYMYILDVAPYVHVHAVYTHKVSTDHYRDEVLIVHPLCKELSTEAKGPKYHSVCNRERREGGS